MVTAITDGIKISVESNFQQEYSSPSHNHFVFTYKIKIENCSEHTMQLKRRHWHIHDSNNSIKEVEGEGVVGQQPVLEPGQIHEYVSGSNLQSGLGKMYGTYQMERIVDGKIIDVTIPEFTLIVPYLLN
jgi:ApaG protein